MSNSKKSTVVKNLKPGAILQYQVSDFGGELNAPENAEHVKALYGLTGYSPKVASDKAAWKLAVDAVPWYYSNQ